MRLTSGGGGGGDNTAPRVPRGRGVAIGGLRERRCRISIRRVARLASFYFLFPSLSRAIRLTSRSRFLHTADELEPTIGKHKSDVDVLERKLEHAEAQS